MRCIVALVAALAATASASAKLVFSGMPTPRGDDRHDILIAKKVDFDGHVKPVGYNVIHRSGMKHGGRFGAHVDKNGDIVVSPDTGRRVSNYADFTSLIDLGTKTCGGKERAQGNIIFSITHFESPSPATAYLTKLIQNRTTGELTVDNTRPLDFSKYGGVWTPCAGSVSPWNTHLGSEEFEPDARSLFESPEAYVEEGSVLGYLLYKGVDVSKPINASTVTRKFNPYDYGWIWEADIDAMTEEATVAKHYAVGRNGYEMSYVMPDNRTVFTSVDGSNKPCLLFKADRQGDLSSGHLYAAKMTQTSATVPAGGSFEVGWVSLGWASSKEIEEYVKQKITFGDLFWTAEPDLTAASRGEVCPAGYTAIHAGEYGSAECLKVKPGMARAASRLETTRYAGIKGATTEFNKWEGLTYDRSRNRIYFSISDVSKGMEDSTSDGYDIGNENDIRLPQNECGCVYEFELYPASAFLMAYWPKKLRGLVCGRYNPLFVELPEDVVVPENSPADRNLNRNNFCDLLGIANPDNIAYVPGHDGLLIGEDSSGGHQNDLLWYMDMTNGKMDRVHSTPFGSEATSTYYYRNINSFAYFLSVIQHPYTESDEDRLDDEDSTGLQAYVGFIGEPGQAFPRYGVLCDPSRSQYQSCRGRPCVDGVCEKVRNGMPAEKVCPKQ